MYRFREKLFDKTDSFRIPYTDNQQLFTKMAIFDFESVCAEDEVFKDTETTTWTGKHVPFSVSISSNSIQEPIFLCDPNPRDMVSSIIDASVKLFTQHVEFFSGVCQSGAITFTSGKFTFKHENNLLDT